MSAMVERVARAIAEVGDPVSQDFGEWRLAVARAAIAAMREPTPEMRAARYVKETECTMHYTLADGTVSVRDDGTIREPVAFDEMNWRLGIDAALT